MDESAASSEPLVTVTASRAPLGTAAASSVERALDRQVFYLHAIAQVGRTLARVATLDQLFVEIVDYFTEIAAVRWTCVYLRDDAAGAYRRREAKVALPEQDWTPPESVREADVADLWAGGGPRLVEAGPLAGGGRANFLPLFVEGAPTGFLLFGAKVAGGDLPADEREFLSTLGAQAALALRHAALLEDTARRVVELRLVNDVARLFTRAREPFAENLQAMWRTLASFLTLEGGLFVPLRETDEEILLGGEDLGEAAGERIRRWCALLLADVERGGLLRRGEVLILEGEEIAVSFPAEFRPPGVAGRAFAVLPVFYDQELEAIFVLRARGPAAPLRACGQLLRQLSPTVSAALQKAWDHQKLNRLATTDGLTGLYNHRYFHEKLQEHYLRAYRLKERLGLLFVDVDHFKGVNDAFGHVFGDEVLLRIADALKAAVREIDVVARYGGEEFAVILPQSGAEESSAIGERVRLAVERLPVRPSRRSPRLTVSVGAASYPENAPTKEKLVEAADQALYRAKGEGRNRVSVAAAAG